MSRQAFNDFRRRLDYREYGGAQLLGVRGVCVIGHGSSNDRAIYNGIRVAYEFAHAGTNERIEQEFLKRPVSGMATGMMRDGRHDSLELEAG